MGGRFSSKFKSVQSFAEPVVVPFDQVKACRLVSDAVSLVVSSYPAAECMDWLRENRPDVYKLCRQAEIAVEIVAIGEAGAEELTWLAEHSPKVHALALTRDFGRALLQGLEIYSGRWLKAFELFVARPPVIERQEAFTL